jgi:hypothetical protein
VKNFILSTIILLNPNPKSGFTFAPGWVREPARTAERRQDE